MEASHTSYHVVRQGLATAHCSSRNVLRRWSKFPAAPAVRLQAKAPPPTALFTMGVAIYGALLYMAGAAPALLPAVYLLFAAVSGPWRAWDFLRRKNAFFLIDFCYVWPLATQTCARLFVASNAEGDVSCWALAQESVLKWVDELLLDNDTWCY